MNVFANKKRLNGKKAKSFLALSFLFFSIYGCRSIDTPDGKVPPNEIETVKSIVGNYTGKFNEKLAEIEIVFNSDELKLIYHDQFGADPLDSQCRSKIGPLKQIILDKDAGNEFVHTLVFNFDPGECRSIVGREVILEFKGEGELHSSESQNVKMNAKFKIVHHMQRHLNCRPRGGCSTSYSPVYITGEFRRFSSMMISFTRAWNPIEFGLRY